MPIKRYTNDNKKPYGKGFGYGGFANVAFRKSEYEALHNGEIVTISGVVSKHHPQDTYTVRLKYIGQSDKDGRDRFAVVGPWVKDEKELLRRDAVVESKFGDVVEASDKSDAAHYVHLSREDAEKLTDEEISNLALAYQDARDDEFGVG